MDQEKYSFPELSAIGLQLEFPVVLFIFFL